jgi:hypothetical protein
MDSMRRFIVSTFAFLCYVIVIGPPAILLLISLGWFAGLALEKYALVLAIAWFVGASFIAGGAFTLLEIAHNTRTTVEQLAKLIQQHNEPQSKPPTPLSTTTATPLSTTPPPVPEGYEVYEGHPYRLLGKGQVEVLTPEGPKVCRSWTQFKKIIEASR